MYVPAGTLHVWVDAPQTGDNIGAILHRRSIIGSNLISVQPDIGSIICNQTRCRFCLIKANCLLLDLLLRILRFDDPWPPPCASTLKCPEKVELEAGPPSRVVALKQSCSLVPDSLLYYADPTLTVPWNSITTPARDPRLPLGPSVQQKMVGLCNLALVFTLRGRTAERGFAFHAAMQP